jgi:NAD(P)H-quinone oxidoreductase subunit 5
VSALLHAGIINAGGFLVLRMADVMAASAPALDLLLMVGALTACFGAAVMLTQTSVKVQLAWSTIAQMGFMMMQCGLGAFASALLHIVAHAVYKAHAFLSAGSVAQGRRAEKPAPLPASLLLPALAASVVLVLGTGALFGMPAGEKPGAAVLGAVLMMGLAPTLAASLGARATVPLALRAAGIAVLVCAAYFALQAGAEALLAAALPVDAAPRGLVAVLLSVLAVASFATLLVLNVMRRAAAPSPHVQALHVHLSNGFYLNTATNRLVARIWPQQGTR